MDIDSEILVSSSSGAGQGERERARGLNKTGNGIVIASMEITDQDGLGEDVGFGQAHDRITSQHHESHANLKAHDTSELEHAVWGRVKASSPTENGPPSKDELMDGDCAWTMPMVQPKLLATGLCYDVRMRYHCELDPPKQRLDFHPEDPRRIYHIYRELCQAGLYKDPQINVPIIDKPLERIRARNATASEICLVHDPRHYEFVARTAAMSDDDLVHLERQYDSIYFNKLTFASALLSTGGAIETCKAVVSGKVKNAIAVIRPPGHHAECNRPMGFCLFDNVSVAAKVCQADYPETCRKVLILDWNINVPWPTKGMGDADYLYTFQQVVMPVAYDFNPDLVIIAAGFDAAVGDQLGGCFVTPTCYAHMAHMLSPLANGKLVVCLEVRSCKDSTSVFRSNMLPKGGYNLSSISKSALAVTRTLLGEPPDRIEETTPTKSGAATVDMVRAYQCRFWPCLRSESKSSTKDALRAYQKQQMCDEFDMIELSVFRDRISKSFKHQVLATINYADKVPLIVFFHDPYHHQTGPEMTRLADTELNDTLNWYRQWAFKEGFAIIDVNFPNHVADIDEVDELDSDKELEHAKHMAERAELAIYLWENYIEPNDSTAIFFMGVGSPSKEIVYLLNNRESFFQRVSAILSFLDTSTPLPLPSVSDQNTYYLSKWYKQNSLIYLSASHQMWNGDRKPSKRFGNVKRSEVDTGVNDMLEYHREEVVEFVRRKSLSGGKGGR
ncbi:MAG: hypothetical protein Q9188_006635 [Gyalolechia gomerana]